MAESRTITIEEIASNEKRAGEDSIFFPSDLEAGFQFLRSLIVIVLVLDSAIARQGEHLRG
jgi:hypothetical protein